MHNILEEKMEDAIFIIFQNLDITNHGYKTLTLLIPRTITELCMCIASVSMTSK